MKPEERAERYVLIRRRGDGNYEARLCGDDPLLPAIRLCNGNAGDVSRRARQARQVIADIIRHALAEECKTSADTISPVARGVLTSS